MLHQMRLRQFTRRQSIPDVQITPCERKHEPEVIIEHDDLYARAWECEYEKSTFYSDYNNGVTSNSPEITVRFQVVADETSIILGIIRESSLEVFSHADRLCEATDTDHYMGLDVDTSLQQPNGTPTNPCISIYDLRLNRKPNCCHDNRF